MKKRTRGKTTACPVCAGTDVAFKYRIERHNFDVWMCSDCRSEFQHPRPKKAHAFYDEGYYTGASAFNYQDERQKEYYHQFVHRERLRTICRFLTNAPTTSGTRRLRPPERPKFGGALAAGAASGEGAKFLDVGCAFGALARAAAATGFEAYGLDVSAYAVREGNRIPDGENPPKLFAGDLSHLPRREKKIFAPESFSVITLIEVAEHLDAPRADLATAFRLLRPGGVLVIQTANFEGLQAARTGSAYHYYLPGHLTYYTATGLKRMLTEIGFREFKEFFPVDFTLWAKWRKAWGDVTKPSDLVRFWRMSIYHWKSKWRRRGRPLTSSYVLYAKK